MVKLMTEILKKNFGKTRETLQIKIARTIYIYMRFKLTESRTCGEKKTP